MENFCKKYPWVPVAVIFTAFLIAGTMDHEDAVRMEKIKAHYELTAQQRAQVLARCEGK